MSSNPDVHGQMGLNMIIVNAFMKILISSVKIGMGTVSKNISRMVFVMYTIQILQRVFFNEPLWFNVFYFFNVIITNTVQLSQYVFSVTLN